MSKKLKILGGALGDCVHVAGIVQFLRMAEELGYHTEFTGPATSVPAFIAAAQEESGEFRPGTPASQPYQPPLFAAEHPVVEELRQLDIATLTPIEAINKLYELQRQVTRKRQKRKKTRKG